MLVRLWTKQRERMRLMRLVRRQRRPVAATTTDFTDEYAESFDDLNTTHLHLEVGWYRMFRDDPDQALLYFRKDLWRSDMARTWRKSSDTEKLRILEQVVLDISLANKHGDHLGLMRLAFESVLRVIAMEPFAPPTHLLSEITLSVMKHAVNVLLIVPRRRRKDGRDTRKRLTLKPFLLHALRWAADKKLSMAKRGRETVSWGSHRGKTFRCLLQLRPQYYAWLDRNVTSPSKEMLTFIKYSRDYFWLRDLGITLGSLPRDTEGDLNQRMPLPITGIGLLI